MVTGDRLRALGEELSSRQEQFETSVHNFNLRDNQFTGFLLNGFPITSSDQLLAPFLGTSSFSLCFYSAFLCHSGAKDICRGEWKEEPRDVATSSKHVFSCFILIFFGSCVFFRVEIEHILINFGTWELGFFGFCCDYMCSTDCISNLELVKFGWYYKISLWRLIGRNYSRNE